MVLGAFQFVHVKCSGIYNRRSDIKLAKISSMKDVKQCGLLVLFDLMLYVPVNSYGNVGTSRPILQDFYPTLR